MFVEQLDLNIHKPQLLHFFLTIERQELEVLKEDFQLHLQYRQVGKVLVIILLHHNFLQQVIPQVEW